MQDDKLSVSPKRGRRPRARRCISILLLLSILLVAAGGGYWWFDGLDRGKSISDVQTDLSLAADQDPVEKKQIVPLAPSSADGDAAFVDGGVSSSIEKPSVHQSDPVIVQEPEEETVQVGVAAGRQNAEEPSSQAADDRIDLQETGQEETPVEAVGVTESGVETRLVLDRQTVTPAASEGRQDDAVVSARFAGNLARWMVQGYHPGRNGKGYVAVGLAAANMHYGTSLQGFNWSGDDPRAGRRDVLAYVFTPGMIRGLYRLYVNPFFQSLDAAIAARDLTDVQAQHMCELYAREFKGLAGVLDGLASMPDLAARLTELTTLAQNVAETDARYGMLAVEHERAKMAGNTSRARVLNRDVKRAMRTYQQALQARERRTRMLISTVKRNADARLLDDSTILFVSSWIGRRFARQQDIQAVRAAAEVSADFAHRLTDRTRP